MRVAGDLPAEPAVNARPGRSRRLTVLLAFDDSPAYERARQVLLQVIAGFTGPLEVQPVLWRLGGAAWPDAEALRGLDAVRADFFIVCATDPRLVPASVGAWSQVWRGQDARPTTVFRASQGPGEMIESIRTVRPVFVALRDGLGTTRVDARSPGFALSARGEEAWVP